MNVNFKTKLLDFLQKTAHHSKNGRKAELCNCNAYKNSAKIYGIFAKINIVLKSSATFISRFTRNIDRKGPFTFSATKAQAK